MCDGMHAAVNASVMCAFVNRLFHGLECEHMSIVAYFCDVALLGELACILWPSGGS